MFSDFTTKFVLKCLRQSSKWIFNLLLIFLFVLTAVFLYKAMSLIPEYGDTQEYIQLAKLGFINDGWRGRMYPLFINSAMKFEAVIDWKIIVYLSQFVLIAVSVMALRSEIIKSNSTASSVPDSVGLYLTLCNPMVLHFATSVMSDSISCSFLLLFLTLFIRYHREKNRFNFFLVVITAVLCAHTRPERSYLLLGFCLMFAFFETVKSPFKWRIHKVKAPIICTLVILINHYIYQPKQLVSQRIAPNLSSFVMSRAAQGRLQEVYFSLPKEMRDVLDYSWFVNADNNYILLTYELSFRIVEKYPDRFQEVFRQIAYNAFKMHSFEIIIEFTSDFFGYLFLPIYFLYSYVLTFFDSCPPLAAWTFSRFSGNSPAFSSIYLGVWGSLYCLWLTRLIVLIYQHRRTHTIVVSKSLNVVLIMLILVSLIFSLTGAKSFGVHIRYGLPNLILFSFLIEQLFCFRVITHDTDGLYSSRP